VGAERDRQALPGPQKRDLVAEKPRDKQTEQGDAEMLPWTGTATPSEAPRSYRGEQRGQGPREMEGGEDVQTRVDLQKRGQRAT